MGLSKVSRAAGAVTVAMFVLTATAGAQTTPTDVGPASLSEGAGDPNLGVSNQTGRTVDFDNGWRFKLVNTANATDPSNTYGDSSDPKAAAPDFPDATWEPVTLPHDWSITQLPSPTQTNPPGTSPAAWAGTARRSRSRPRCRARRSRSTLTACSTTPTCT